MNNNDSLVNDRLLKVKDVQEILQLSRSAVYAAIREGLLPKPIKIGKSARWKASVIAGMLEKLGM
ncbi:MAG: helix-turn-helix domain-containing protein [Comamonas sp.]|jgi:predicted DNA-binding transcriptional regulator AlpA|uniref:helix-turn-helix transcriptional regulator n=1 Tax=Comamonas sp. TaxID=34028 RepID=UPI00281C6D4E|nr:helix-turn-helix domain-containing protein [Comamonas sp.]MDR0215584.1 helix-turn-helix domain-containing protein [Comamonas sp.]MDR2297041.1 helix-turn-helix domain-containing protein [Comamonas sp.]